MSSITFEILLIVLLIIANGVFASSEIAIVSARKVRLEQLAKRGNVNARLALKLANSPNDFLSAVQIGITLIGILSGAVGGATLSLRLEEFFKSIPPLASYSEPLSIGLVVTIITYLSLVVGELVPKRIGLNNPEQIACNVARPMQLLTKSTAPVVHLLSISTEWLLKLLGIRASDEPLVTEEEIKGLIEQGTQAGTFEEAEQEMVTRVFRLGDRPIRTLMTPRVAITWLDIDDPLPENQRKIMGNTYSRFPVAQGRLDNCIGTVRVKDFLCAHLSGKPIDFNQILQPPLFVAESTRALNVLEIFRQSGKHLALVTDEYGGIEGLVTLNDVVEAVVGDMPSENLNEPKIIQREDGSWLVDGMLAIDDLKELLQREELPEENRGYYRTLAGFVMTSLGRIPSSGEHFEWSAFRFEVVDMDGARVDKVLVTRLQTTTANEEIEP